MMTPGLAAFFTVMAVLLGSYAIFAPRNQRPESTQLGAKLGDEVGLFEKWVRPTIQNVMAQSPMSLTEYAQRNEGVKSLLARSGNPWRISPEEYVIFRVLAGITTGLFLLFFSSLGYLSAPPILSMFVGIAAGQLIPKALLDSKWSARRKSLNRTLPDALDLLRICMNSGMNFTNALIQTVSLAPPGVTREELARVIAEVGAGRSLNVALTSLATRCPTEGIEAFARAIIQAQDSGSDIASTLSYQSDETRASYERAVEIRSQKLQTTLFLPIIGLFIPSLMILIFGPTLSSITTSL
jgi:tight adherence protein C